MKCEADGMRSRWDAEQMGWRWNRREMSWSEPFARVRGDGVGDEQLNGSRPRRQTAAKMQVSTTCYGARARKRVWERRWHSLCRLTDYIAALNLTRLVACRMLSPQTAINVFVLIAYNRNATRQEDTWYMQIALRDRFAPASPPGMKIPPFIVVYETPKIGARYPKVDTPLAQGMWVYNLDTDCLYDPESIPNLNPPLPASFVIDAEQIRNTIVRYRRP